MKNDFTTNVEGTAKGMTEEERERIMGEAAMLAEAKELQEAPIKRYLSGAYKVSTETLTPPQDPKGRKYRQPKGEKPVYIHADGSEEKIRSQEKAAEEAIKEFFNPEDDPEETSEPRRVASTKRKKKGQGSTGWNLGVGTTEPKPFNKRKRKEAADLAKAKKAERAAAEAAKKAAEEEARKATEAAAAEEKNTGFFYPQDFTGVPEGEAPVHDPKTDRLPTVSNRHKCPGTVFTD